MSNNKNLIEHLQELVSGLFHQTNMRTIQCEVFRSCGFNKLSSKYDEHLKEETEYLKEAINQIIDLGGDLNIAKYSKSDYSQSKIYKDPIEYLKSELEISKNGIAWLKNVIEEAKQEYITYDFLVKYLKDEQEDMNWTSCQLELIETIGKENWLIKNI